MLVDLHMHSRYSDGGRWPAELAVEAARTGLQGAALTDHDTLGGVEEFREAAAAVGLHAWVGVEIDCSVPELDYRSELLAYFPSGRSDATRAFLDRIVALRRERTASHVREARRIFGRSDLSFQELQAEKLGRAAGNVDANAVSLSRVDLFAYLVRKGAISATFSYRDFRKAFFETGILKDSKYRKPSLTDIMKPLLTDGGLAVIPHIGHRFDDDPERLASESVRLQATLVHFRAAGVAGLELYAYDSSVRERLNRSLRKAAEPLGYFFTYGSDCHGPGSGRERLGEFSGEFERFPGEEA